MDHDLIAFRAIGVIRSPISSPEGAPIQPSAARGVRGTVVLLPELAGGLRDLEGFSHVILAYHLHMSRGYDLVVTPFLDDAPHGVFATRAPRRPNPIGLSVVRLVSVDGNILSVEDVDVVDGTPLLDIKPYVPAFDAPTGVRLGWLDGRADDAADVLSDERFG